MTRSVAHECSDAASVLERAGHARECDVSLQRESRAEERRAGWVLRIVDRIRAVGLEELQRCALRQLCVRELRDDERDDRCCDPSTEQCSHLGKSPW